MLIMMIYLIIVIVTWLYAGLISGRELAEIKARIEKGEVQPQYIQINYVNVFFQGLCWPSYWTVFIGQWLYRRGTK
jgi:hypothetical protein